MSDEQKPVDVITIKRSITQHKDILDVVDYYRPKYGTAAQTFCVLVRESPLYLEWQKQQMHRETRKGRRGKDNPAARGQRSGRD